LRCASSSPGNSEIRATRHDPSPAIARRIAEKIDVNHSTLFSTIGAQWDKDIVPQLTDYIRIPAKSPHFDPQWQSHGHIERVIVLAHAWVRKQPVRGLSVELVRLPGRTPLLYFDVAGAGDRTALLYGHLDKQPEMTGWRQGYGPWDPLYEDGKLVRAATRASMNSTRKR
jgi:hypothetical protein